ncbi:hypothetical protein SY83_07065 [Paenibacillus swuensis]|uniref:Rieske domain-containing protein n=1 Tax=Paenibacillus swuensis TaxID=1178515 RepID=A0A172TGJ4_9BACL|nr:Rieske (2Fe-2S) protein [Paenibacillus swuensis]ANE46082.1 hypothetical protein SY83_07065 [Paenibacillus swuensis]
MTLVTVAKTSDIVANKTFLVQVERKEIGILLDHNQYYAVLNICPHAKAPICSGHIEGTLIAPQVGIFDYQHDRRVLRCPWHHWEFELPSGRAVCNMKERIKTYPVVVQGEDILIDI